MADVKWIKICTDLFDDEKILMIESLPSADTIIVIWFKLLTFAGKQNNDGVFLMNNRIAYTDEMLATIFRRDVNVVRFALNTFQEFGMIEIVSDVITIPNWNKHQTLDAYEKKKERDRLYQQERRAKQRLLVQGNTLCEQGLPLNEWKQVLKIFNNECAYCGEKDGLEQEHIIPLIKGGKYEIGNIIPACRHCNASKKDKELVAWYTNSDVFDAERLQYIMEYVKSSDKSSDKSSYVVISEEDKEKDKDKDKEIYIYIVDYLNQKAGTKYKHSSKKTQTCIHARLAEGFTVDDFKTVIDKKCADWLGDQKMEQYLRPETLFGTKFEGYLNAKTTKKPANTGIPLGDSQDDLDGLF